MNTSWPEPVPVALPGSTRIVHKADIACPPGKLFEFVTNASRWHRWHPATHAVRGVPDRSLGLGEAMVEHIKAACACSTATSRAGCWRARPPARWLICNRWTGPHGLEARAGARPSE